MANINIARRRRIRALEAKRDKLIETRQKVAMQLQVTRAELKSEKAKK